MKKLHPFTFNPIFIEKIWGGNKLKTQINKNCSSEKTGESWEISCVKESVSQINNGLFYGQLLQDIINQYKGDLLGQRVYQKYGKTFPLLIKFIDASDNLSIQVHPNDLVAQEKHNCLGKNEMWVILNEDNQANLWVGFKKKTTEEEYLSAVNNNSLDILLNNISAKKGDAFYIPSGTIHGIGKGTILVEIQQSSDITYRIYDYNRTDELGKERTLHTEEALRVIDYAPYNPSGIDYMRPETGQSNMVKTPYFTVNYISVLGALPKDYSEKDSFIIYICIEGKVAIEAENKFYFINFGETILIPSCIKNLILHSDKGAKLLEVYL